MSETGTAGARKAPASPSALFGFCGTEAKSELGPTGAGSEWHARCPGAVATGRGLVRCSCAAHDADRKCYICGCEVEPSEEYDPNQRRHVNSEACEIALDLRVAGSRAEHRAMLAAVTETAAQNRAARRAARTRTNGDPAMTEPTFTEPVPGSDPAPDPAPDPVPDADPAPAPTPAPARPRKPKAASQRCHDGCGGMTKGGLFLAGHDAKLKSRLRATSTTLNYAELIARGWAKTGELTDEQTAKGQAEIDEIGGPQQLIAARVATRYNDDDQTAPQA